MAERPGPATFWAIVEDKRDGLRYIHGVYAEAEHAIEDSGQLQNQDHFVEVVPFEVHRAPQWSSWREPALEQTDDDFDVVVPDETTPAPSSTSGGSGTSQA